MNSNNPTNTAKLKAAALAYSGSGAPRLTAKGEDQLAADMLALAEEHWIPTVENPLLVDLLCQLELNQEIPESLYTTIAHLLTFAYRLGEQLEANSRTG